MALISSINQYTGINTHFQSYAQNVRDGWSSFHAAHVVHLADAIARLLPSGYEVAPEASLQIRKFPAPDVTVWDTEPLAVPVATRPAVEMSDRTQRLSAVLIYADNEPVTRLEILSPTNKKDKEKRGQYLAKRAAAQTVIRRGRDKRTQGAIPAHVSPSPIFGEGFGVRIKRAGIEHTIPVPTHIFAIRPNWVYNKTWTQRMGYGCSTTDRGGDGIYHVACYAAPAPTPPQPGNP